MCEHLDRLAGLVHLSMSTYFSIVVAVFFLRKSYSQSDVSASSQSLASLVGF
jgi:hypothetical protein